MHQRLAQVLKTSLTTAAAGIVAAGLAAGGAAGCAPADRATGGKVKITVSNMPPTTQERSRRIFLDQVAAFEKANPNIDIEPTESKWEAKTFAARLAGGQLETVFMVPLTEPASLTKRRQIADLTDDVRKLPHFAQFDKRALAPATDAKGRVYGLPIDEYAIGLAYNRDLFTKAGLDPDKPPKTWEEVRAAAKAIAAKAGVPGFAMHSTNNTGGWILTTMAYTFGGRMEKEQDGKYVSTVTDPGGQQALDLLKAMRWTDNSMGAQHLRNQDDLQRDFAAGKIGMMVSAPDAYNSYVVKYSADPAKFGMAALPTGTTSATLLGGSVAVVSPKASKAERAAAVKWIDFYHLKPKYDPAAAEARARAAAADKLPVGVPRVPFYEPSVSDPVVAAERKHATVPLENFAPYAEGVADQEFVVEPPVSGQELYAALDTAVQAILTRQNADPAEELRKVDTKIAPILVRAQR